MNITLENIDELNSTIKINIEKSDYEPQIEKVLKDYQKKVNMQGFRPGKVPMGLIQRRYRTAVLAEEMNKIVSDGLTKYISENKIGLLGDPIPNESQKTLDLEHDENFEIAFDIAITPKFDVNLSQDIILPYYNITVSDDMIDYEITNLKSRARKKEISFSVTENSLVKGDFEQVDDSGNTFETSLVAIDSTISMDIIKDEEAKNQLIGKTIDESIIFDLRKAYPDDTELSYILKITEEEASNVTGNFIFTIKEITDYIDTEVNQDFFDKTFGVGIVTSEEEMKVKIKENFKKQFVFESDYKFQSDARNLLLSKIGINLPEEFLKRWMKITAKDNKSNLEDDSQNFFEDLKWQLVIDYITKTNSIEVTDLEVFDYAEKYARLQFMQYGLYNIPDEHINKFASDLMKEEKNQKIYFNGAFRDKTIAYIKKSVKLDYIEISKDDFHLLVTEK